MKKELNFDVNIMPVLDILSVMICFLLLTAVWSTVQSMDVQQAVGDNNMQAGKNPPSVWAVLSDNGRVQISLRDIPQARNSVSREQTIEGVNSEINWTQLETSLRRLKQAVPELKVALVMPKANSNYGNIIKVLDQFRKVEISDVGVAPL